MKLKKISILPAVVLICANSGLATLVNLTDSGLGISRGNYDTSLVIDQYLTLTALTHIVGDSSLVGTIYIDHRDKGIGVQNSYGGGSKGISGAGDDQDEALILNFNAAMRGGSLSIGLNEYDYSDDNTTITLLLSDGQELSFNQNSQNWSNALTPAGSRKVTVNIGALLDADFSGSSVASVSVLETTGHIYVDSVNYELQTTSVPEPASIAILFMGMLLMRTKKQ